MTNKPTHSTVSHGMTREFTTCDILQTGQTSRYCTDVILYDESGPLITNYTNGNAYEFDTLRPISTKALEAPDWNNESGFLIKEMGTFRAQCEGRAVYLLFVHIDNLKPYAREFYGHWALEGRTSPGVIGCELSIEGCRFARFVSNPRIREAAEGVKAVVDQYEENPSYSPLSSGYSACHHLAEAEAFCKDVLESLRFYRETVEAVETECGIVELIHENGADQPIGPNDWYDLQHHFNFLKNTYRLETV